MVAAAIVGGAVIGGVASNMAAGEAADAQTAAAQSSNATQLAIFNQQRADQQPWREVGAATLPGLASLAGSGGAAPAASIAQMYRQYLGRNADQAGLQHWIDAYNNGTSLQDIEKGISSAPEAVQAYSSGKVSPTGDFTMNDFQADPGYQFRLDEGQKALERSAAARGGLMSGATMKALTRYSQGVASDEFQNAYNRFNNDRTNRFNRLASLAGTGQTANNQLAQAGQNYANQVSANNAAMGNAQAASSIASGNAVNNAIGTGMNTWMQYQMMNRAFPQASSSGGSSSAGFQTDMAYDPYANIG